MIKAVLFDMDGVIVNSEPAYVEIELELAAQLGIPLTKEEQRKYTGVHHYEMWKELKEKYGFAMPLEEIVRMESEHIDEYYNSGDIRPISATVELIRELHLRGVLCAIATSNDGHNAERVAERLGIKQYISAIASYSRVKNCKPAPDIFLLAAEMLEVNPLECLVVEDSKNGCIAAKAAGMKVIGYVNPCSGNQDLSCADASVSRMEELTPEYMEKCGIK